MKKIFFKKQLIIFSALAFIGYGVLWACADGDWDEYGTSAYAPEAFVDSAYKPFFYSDQFYYEIGHDNGHSSRFNETIVKEWKQYLGANADEVELDYFLITATKDMVDSVNLLPINLLPPSVASMKLVKAKSDRKVAAFLEFLAFAKANESYAVNETDYWGYDDDKPAIKKFSNQQKDAAVSMEKVFNNTEDNFIKQRYFFQLIRNYFFQAQYADCIAFFEKHKSDFPQNIIAARCTSYIAGAYYKQKNYAQANYLFSKVYDVSTDFKTVAHFSFHPQNESDWKQTLALCKTKEEQITLWQLLGIYFDEERSIKEIYALNPKSEKLDLLLARLVNIQEQRVNTFSVSYYDSKASTDSLKEKTISLVSQIADEQKTSKPYLWQLSAGYLSFLKHDYNKAKSYYALAEKVMPKTELAQAQIRLFKMMNKVAGCTKIDKKFEEELLPDLEWLNGIGYETIPAFRSSSAYGWIKESLSDKYKRQNELIRSELFKHEDTFYTNPQLVTAVKTFMLNKNATAFEKYCQSIYPIKPISISEFQAVQFAFQDKLDEAINLMQETDSLKDYELLGNPFNGNIMDCHDCDHAAKQKVKYTKLSFLQKMKEMKSNVLAGTDVYNNALLLGNAFYNMSHFGNARLFYEGEVIGYAQSTPDMISNSFSAMLLDCSTSKKYYKKALSVATNDEQKAKMSYLLLKIERNEHYLKLFASPDYNSWDYADTPPTNFSTLFPYKSTKYYQEVIAECGYFRSYLKNHSK